jgi:hypothetical protein
VSKLNRNGFRDLELDARVTLIGQLLLTTGTAFLSLGQIFKLLKSDELPTVPINAPQLNSSAEKQSSLYSARKSYFES